MPPFPSYPVLIFVCMQMRWRILYYRIMCAAISCCVKNLVFDLLIDHPKGGGAPIVGNVAWAAREATTGSGLTQECNAYIFITIIIVVIINIFIIITIIIINMVIIKLTRVVGPDNKTLARVTYAATSSISRNRSNRVSRSALESSQWLPVGKLAITVSFCERSCDPTTARRIAHALRTNRATFRRTRTWMACDNQYARSDRSVWSFVCFA